MSNPAPDPLELVPLPMNAGGDIDFSLRVGLLESSGIPVLVKGRYDLKANRRDVMVLGEDYEDAVRILSEAPEPTPDSGAAPAGIVDRPKDETFNRLLPWVLGGLFVYWLLRRF